MAARRVLAAGWGVLAMLCAAGPAERSRPKPGEAERAELKRLEGEWKVVAAEQGGAPVESDARIRFAGRKLTIRNPSSTLVLENTVRIDPAQKPKWMDVTNVRTGQTWRGIYELKGDTLKAVFPGAQGDKRPAEFKTAKGSRDVMFTYRRVKAK